MKGKPKQTINIVILPKLSVINDALLLLKNIIKIKLNNYNTNKDPRFEQYILKI